MTNAQGRHSGADADYILVDLPGTYSLMAHSAEEEVARDFICFGGADAVVVVCDATCLERNLNLVLQIMEITPRVVVCVNLCDEAKRKGILIDFAELERFLGVPVVPASARSGKGLRALIEKIEGVISGRIETNPVSIRYCKPVEDAVALLLPALEPLLKGRLSARWLALRLLDFDEALVAAAGRHLGEELTVSPGVCAVLGEAQGLLGGAGIEPEKLRDRIVAGLVLMAEQACGDTVLSDEPRHSRLDRRLDRVLTSRATGIPIMLALLCGVFWLTITGANVPSALLSRFLFQIQDYLTALFLYWGAPDWLHGAVVLGVYRVLACDAAQGRAAQPTGFLKNSEIIPVFLKPLRFHTTNA